MQVALCRHIKTNGTQCEAPSPRPGRVVLLPLPPPSAPQPLSPHRSRHRLHRPRSTVHLNALEDRDSVQVALSVVINALASGQMEPRQATALLYGLQIASSNLARMNSNPSPAKIVVSAEPTSDGQYLAEPGAVYEITDNPNSKLAWGYEYEEEEEDENEVDEE